MSYLACLMWESSIRRLARRADCCCKESPFFEITQTKASVIASRSLSRLSLLSLFSGFSEGPGNIAEWTTRHYVKAITAFIFNRTLSLKKNSNGRLSEPSVRCPFLNDVMFLLQGVITFETVTHETCHLCSLVLDRETSEKSIT